MRLAKLIIFSLSLIIFISCSSQSSKIVVAEFGDNKIYMDEFEKAYANNPGGLEKAKTDSLSSLRKFLDLYVSYKMKLRDASVRGYKTDDEMKKEFFDYKNSIGKTLFIQANLYEPNLKRLYDRRKTEYRVSHIFLLPDSSRDVQQTIEFGKQLIQRIQKGEDFASLAKQYSKDTYTNMIGGDVYYVVAGQIPVSKLEDALYQTEPGNTYPEVVSSGQGFHVLKVTEKIPRKSSIRVQHILIPFADSTGVTDSLRALKQIQDVENQLKEGKDFGQLAKKFSSDRASAVKNGDIGFFQRGQMVREFDEAAFKLNVGEVSKIVKTNFGYHLIKLLEIGQDKSYEDEKAELKDVYDRVRYQNDYDELVMKLKKEFNFTQNLETFNKILAFSDTIKTAPDYLSSTLKAKVGADEIFRINNRVFTCDSLFNYIIRTGENYNKTVNGQLLKDAIDKYSSELLFTEKTSTYDQENLEFAKLLKDYENGMYLFKILEEEVWSKVSIDSAKIFAHWEKTKENYRWKDRVEFKEIFNRKDSLINKCYASAISGASYDSLFGKYNQRFNNESTPGYKGLVDVEINELAKQTNSLNKIGDISKPFSFEGGWSIVKLVKRDPARLKSFDEAKAEVASVLQELETKRLENEYMNKLRNLYHPKIYYEELHKAFKTEN